MRQSCSIFLKSLFAMFDVSRCDNVADTECPAVGHQRQTAYHVRCDSNHW